MEKIPVLTVYDSSLWIFNLGSFRGRKDNICRLGQPYSDNGREGSSNQPRRHLPREGGAWVDRRRGPHGGEVAQVPGTQAHNNIRKYCMFTA